MRKSMSTEQDEIGHLLKRLLGGDAQAEGELRRLLVPQLVREVRRIVVCRTGDSVVVQWLRQEIARRLHGGGTQDVDRRQLIANIAESLSGEIIERLQAEESSGQTAEETIRD